MNNKRLTYGTFDYGDVELPTRATVSSVGDNWYYHDYANSMLKKLLSNSGLFSGDYHITTLPDRVFFNDKKGATTILYGDEATVVKTTKGDKFDKKFGFLLAYFQKHSGLTKTQANKYLSKLVEEKDNE
jgi:hypothetical protein